MARASPSTRTGSDATTPRRRRTSGAATSSSRTPSDRDMLAVSWSDDGGLDVVRRRRHRRAAGGRRVPRDPADGRARRRLPLGSRPGCDRRIAFERRRRDVGCAGSYCRREELVCGARVPRVPAPVRRRRPQRARLGDVARLRARRLVQRRLRRDLGRRGNLDGGGRGDPQPQRGAAGDRDRRRYRSRRRSPTCGRGRTA